MRRTCMYWILTIVVLGGLPLSAHDEFRIIGTVATVQASKLGVKMKERTVSIALDKQTTITRDKKKVDASQLKAGQSVVVDAYGDSYDDLLALAVRIVPAIAPSSAK